MRRKTWHTADKVQSRSTTTTSIRVTVLKSYACHPHLGSATPGRPLSSSALFATTPVPAWWAMTTALSPFSSSPSSSPFPLVPFVCFNVTLLSTRLSLTKKVQIIPTSKYRRRGTSKTHRGSFSGYRKLVFRLHLYHYWLNSEDAKVKMTRDFRTIELHSFAPSPGNSLSIIASEQSWPAEVRP